VTSYGISDAEAVGDGLTCGGTAQVFVHEIGERERPAMTPVREAGAEGTPTVLATLSQGTKPRHLRSTVSLPHNRRPLADAPTALAPDEEHPRRHVPPLPSFA
jgi:xanthine/CO dehydrogenase XdhC/CoxF family maturation factor